MPSLYLVSGFLLAVWIFLIYLTIMVRKKKTDTDERRYKMLKTFLLVAVISLPVFIVGIRVSIGLYYGYEPASFVIGVVAFVAFGVFVLANIGSLVIFLMGRRKPT